MADTLKAHMKKITRGDGDATAFDLILSQDIDVAEILPSRTQIKQLSTLSSVFDFVTGVIHGIPQLFEEPVELKDLDVYLGRSSLDQVANRWMRHLDTRDHSYGIVCCRVPEDKIETIEEGCLRIFNRLRHNEILCISNKSEAAVGRASSKLPVIYLTFRVDKRLKEKPMINSDDVRRISHFIDEDSGGEYTSEEVGSAMERLKKHSDSVKLIWHPEHR